MAIPSFGAKNRISKSRWLCLEATTTAGMAARATCCQLHDYHGSLPEDNIAAELIQDKDRLSRDYLNGGVSVTLIAFSAAAGLLRILLLASLQPALAAARLRPGDLLKEE